MRIAVVTTSYPKDDDDASGHFVRAEVSRLEQSGAEVRVFVPSGAAFGWPGVAARIREKPARALTLPIGLARVARSFRAAGPFDRTIAHFAIPSALPLAQFAGARARGELEIVSHGGDVRLLVALPKAVRRAAVRAMLRHASCWRFPSESLLAQLTSSLSRDDALALDRVAAVVAPALDMPDITGEVARLRAVLNGEVHADRREPLWVCAARLIPSKRIDWAIEHAATHRAHLAIIGDGPERDRLETLARARGADVRFLGKLPRRETLAWIAVADALVHASEAEGLSTVVREARTLGTRVIVRPS